MDNPEPVPRALKVGVGGAIIDAQGQVIGNQARIHFQVPPSLQGANLTADFAWDGHDISQGPFRFDFFLCNPLAPFCEINQADPDAGNQPQVPGEACLVVPEQVDIAFEYEAKDGSKQRGSVKFTVGAMKTVSISLAEIDLEIASDLAARFMAQILDSISFRKEVPLQIGHLDVYHSPSGRFRRRVFRLPYRTATFEWQDVFATKAMPQKLYTFFRLFRESRNSTSPYYRLLCLYKIHEGLKGIRGQNNHAVLKKGTKPVRPKRTMPDIDSSRNVVPELIGKPVETFFDQVREKYRINIAHMKFGEDDSLLLDPASAVLDGHLDLINSVMQGVLKQMLMDENDFMRKHSLE